MPIYEYECTECGLVAEEMFPYRLAKDTIDCTRPGCNGVAKRRISKNTFRLKGADWTPKFFKKD